MSLRKAMSWSVAQTGARFAVGFIGIKITAVFLGPAGLAVVGQLNNFLSMCASITAGGIQTGVTKMTAEHGDNPALQDRVWSTALRMSLLFALLGASLMALGSYWLAGNLLLNPAYWPIFVLGGTALVAATAYGWMNAILNGLKRMHALALGVIGSAVLSLLLSVPLVSQFGVWGGLVSCATLYFVTLAVSWHFFRRELGGAGARFRAPFDWQIARTMLRFYPMVLANVASAQLSLIGVRWVIATRLDIAQAGIWQASQRISDMYTAIIVSALSLFLMPHLSEIKDVARMKKEMFKVSAKAAGGTAVIALLLYLLRDLVILIVFSPKFSPMRELFQYQLIGDVLMVACWPLRAGLVVRLKVKSYVSVELINALCFVGGSYLLLPLLGLQGVPIAYLSGFIVSLCCVTYLHQRP